MVGVVHSGVGIRGLKIAQPGEGGGRKRAVPELGKQLGFALIMCRYLIDWSKPFPI